MSYRAYLEFIAWQAPLRARAARHVGDEERARHFEILGWEPRRSTKP